MKFKIFIEAQNRDALKQQIHQAAGILRSIVNPTGRKMMSSIPKAHDSSSEFWGDPAFLQWLQSHGIQAPEGEPQYEDGGAGRAYFLGDHVVKFTGNPVEARVAEMVAGRTDLPAPIIDVKQLRNDIFAILEYKVQMGEKVDKKIRDAADWLTVVVDENPEMNGFPKDPAEQEQLIIKTMQEEGGPMDLLPEMKIVMTALSALYQATGFKHDDAGPSNVGIHQGKVVFPDLGPNQPGDFSVDKAMDQINKNRESLGLS